MPINFVPNDPGALRTFPMRVVTPRRNPPAGRAGFACEPRIQPRCYEPGTPEFVYWQSREAALAALATWKSINGPLLSWHRGVQNLPLDILGAETGLNAYYQRHRLMFTRDEMKKGRAFYSAASADYVAHEVGHALLDSFRPALWDSFFTEVCAFHESFGDCMAILTALHDDTTRALLMKNPNALDRRNAVESFGEALGRAVARVEGPQSDSAAPRFALNKFQWSLHTGLPKSGPPPVLTSEPHSFARVFTGCFYDLIRNIAGRSPSSDAVLRAAIIAGRLLTKAADKAPLRVRFFRSVGQAMVEADTASNRARHADAIRSAFGAHGIELEPVPSLEPRTRGMPGVLPGADSVAPLVQRTHEVSLAGLGLEFRDVVVRVPEHVTRSTATRTRAMVPNAFRESEPAELEAEVQSLVETLLAHDQVAMSRDETSLVRSRTMSPRARSTRELPPRIKPTHVIRPRGATRVLERVRFACRCG